MSPAKRTAKSTGGGLGQFAHWILGPGRTYAAGLLILGAFLLGWWAVWQRVGPRVTSSERYLVQLDDLKTTPQPDWIPADVRAEVYQYLRLGGPMSLLDDDLSPRIAEAFARHPWVERVARVTKVPAAGVRVELEYRKPACVVNVEGRLLPIDHRSILLPAEGISQDQLERYPQLVGIHSPPLAAPGEPWGSASVAGGAAIAAKLAEVWEAWHLARIVPFPVITQDGREQLHYALLCVGGTRIVWGLPPGIDVPGEPTASEKLARLKAYRMRHGTFDGPAGPLDLNVRTMRLAPPRSEPANRR